MHNGQDFQYKVSWREAGGKSVHWNHGYIKSPPFSVNNTGTYTAFEIKVQAVNSLGEGPEPKEKIGRSGEDGTSLAHIPSHSGQKYCYGGNLKIILSF